MKKVIRLGAIFLLLLSATVACSVKEKCPAYSNITSESEATVQG